MSHRSVSFSTGVVDIIHDRLLECTLQAYGLYSYKKLPHALTINSLLQFAEHVQELVGHGLPSACVNALRKHVTWASVRLSATVSGRCKSLR